MLQENWTFDHSFTPRLCSRRLHGYNCVGHKFQRLLIHVVFDGKLFESDNSKVLYKPLLDFVQAIVIRIQLLASFHKELSVLDSFRRSDMCDS
jgi:hypothetical protein